MQRKAKVEEARRENVEKRKKLESDFSSSLAKRLCAAVGDSDNRYSFEVDNRCAIFKHMLGFHGCKSALG